MNVALRAMKVDDEIGIIMAGLLHDLPERLPKSYEKISESLHGDVQELVSALVIDGKLSDEKNMQGPLAHMEAVLPAMEQRLKNRVILLKLCDRLDNLKKRKNTKIPRDYARKSKKLFKFLASQYEYDQQFDERAFVELGRKLADVIGCKNYLKEYGEYRLAATG